MTGAVKQEGRMKGTVLAVLVAGALLLPASGSALAAGKMGSPGGFDRGAYATAAGPSDCQVQPRTVDELIAIWYGPGGSAVASPAEAAATEVTIPVGPPADEAIVTDVVATVHEAFACFETGDFLRATALFTDDLIRSFGPEPGVTAEEARAFLVTPEPETEDEASQILAVADVLVLADGRVGAFVVDRSADEGTHVAYAIFEREGDRWMADEVIAFGGAAGEGE